MLKLRASLILILTVVFSLIDVVAQKSPGIVAADGIVEYHNRIPLSGVTMELYSNGNLVATKRTQANGEYHFALDYNKEYIMVIHKEGLVKKKFYYNTNMPEGTRGDWWIGIPINLYEVCPGIDASVFNDPIVKLEFNEKKKQYDVNKDYDKIKKPAVQEFEDKNDRCLEANYVKLVRDADKAFLGQEYDKAKELYQTAADKRPWEIYPQERLEKIDGMLAKQDASDDVYGNTLKQADDMFAREEYFVAKMLYKRASLLKPDEQYPVDKISEIERLTQSAIEGDANKKASEAEYNMLVNNADRALQTKNYEQAKKLYSQAITIKPAEAYPKNKLKEIDRLIQVEQLNAQQEGQINQQYNDLIGKANTLFSQRQFDEAKQIYSSAQSLKPDERLPNDRIKQIDAIIAQREKEQELKQKQAEEAKFNELVKLGDGYLESEDFYKSIQAFKEALEIKPYDGYVKSRIGKAEGEYRKQQDEKEQSEIAFNQFMSQGEIFTRQGKYDEAKSAYQQALQLKPNEVLPKQKLSEIDRLINEQRTVALKQQKEEEYQRIIGEGDKYISSGQYDLAKQTYQRALSLIPEKTLAKQKIEEAEQKIIQAKQLLAEKQKDEADYKKAIADGTALMAQKDYARARQAFAFAANLKPGEQYPKQQLAIIDQNVAELKQQEAQRQEAEQAYKAQLVKGDGFLRQNNATLAKQAYEEALRIKPNDSYAQQKINEVNRLIAEEQAKVNQQRQLEEKFRAVISQADLAMNQKQYDNAKSFYLQAQQLKPNETYPKVQLTKVNSLIEEENKQIALQQKRENDYKKAVADGTALLAQKDYGRAQQAFAFAAKVKPDEQYPKQQLVLIDQKIAELKQQEAQRHEAEQAYKDQLVKGDGFLRQNNATLAKQAYEEALRIKPNDSYAQQKINEVNRLIAEEQAKANQQRQLEEKYKALISQADLSMNQKQYDNAKSLYLQAQKLKPSESYPQTQLTKANQIIEEKREEIALQQKRENDYKNAITKADALFKKADYNGAKEVYQAALNINPTDDYPKKRINQIDDILSKLAAQRGSNTTTVQAAKVEKPKLVELKFNNDNEREQYLVKLKEKYPPGITLEIYKEQKATINRYIIVRDNKASEFREVKYNWGGVDYSVNDKPITSQYFNQQIKRRDNEYFNKVNK